MEELDVLNNNLRSASKFWKISNTWPTIAGKANKVVVLLAVSSKT